jgi:hypothetical protein
MRNFIRATPEQEGFQEIASTNQSKQSRIVAPNSWVCGSEFVAYETISLVFQRFATISRESPDFVGRSSGCLYHYHLFH